MSLNIFKNLKLNRKRQFAKSLEKFNLNDNDLELMLVASDSNILVTIFDYLLKENNLEVHNFKSSENLIKLYSALKIVPLLETENKESLIKQINKDINKIQKTKSNKLPSGNFEEKNIKGYKISKADIQSYFSNHNFYEEIGRIFFEVFDDERYYEFAYQLAMYVTLELNFNEYRTPENIDIFLVKLETQQKMIEVLTYITSENFNDLIISLNKWFKEYDKKVAKLSIRKAGK